MIATTAKQRALASVLIVTLTNTPVLGNLSLPSAAAQTTQNTTYNYQYDAAGNRTQITDPLGNVTNLNYDNLLRLKQQIQPVPSTGVARPTSNFTYDGLSQLNTVVDPRNLTTTYTNDGLGNQSTLSSPDTGTTGRTFDAEGNLLTSTDSRGKVSTYGYDALNRITSVTYASGTPTLFEYDGGTSGAANAIGRLTKITDESGQTNFSYDQAGRVLSKLQTTVSSAGTVIRQVAYAYNSIGQLASMTYPSGNRVSYAYDAGGHIKKMVLNPSDGNGGTDTSVCTVLLDQISYAPFGAVQSWTWGNSTETAPNVYTRTFDLDGRVTTYPLGNPAINSLGVIRTVSYDAGSRITGFTHTGNVTAANYDQTFGYDGLGRLTSFVSATSSQGYAYDASGNRTRLSIGSASFTNSISTTSNRLTATTGPVPAKTNVIDNAGNLTADGTSSFTYNARGRMQSVTKAGLTTSYLYNGLGQRVSKAGSAVDSGSNEFVYDEAGHLIGEYDAAGAMIVETVWLADAPVVLLKASSGTGGASAPAIYHVYSDHIATPRVITDAASGAIVWSWVDSDPFGMAQPNEAPSGGAGFRFNVRFPGQYFDRESYLHYNYFRDYDPALGRYVQSDPIGLGGGVNTFGYVFGSPVQYADPTGEFVPLVFAGVCAAGGCEALIGGAASAAAWWGISRQPKAAVSEPAISYPIASTGSDARSRPSSATKDCQPGSSDPCEEIRRQIRDIEGKLASKRRQLELDPYKLYTRAYSVNPGGDLAGKGTYIGHLEQISGLEVGLARKKAEAAAMGCL